MNDLISRQALCEYALNQKDKSVTPNDIMRFPPAQPERKKGKWILTEDDNYEYCTCSECGYQNGENWMNGSDIPFCAVCGADMRGEDNE